MVNITSKSENLVLSSASRLMMSTATVILRIVAMVLIQSCLASYKDADLPKEHYPYYFYNFPKEAESCINSTDCPYKDEAINQKCWGYETGCPKISAYSWPECSPESSANAFYKQGDFGFIKERLKESKIICEPLFITDSSLECVDHLRFCRGRNIFMNFTDMPRRDLSIRYSMDVLQHGQIGGHCTLHKKRLEADSDHISPLQSWGPELRHFVEMKERPVESGLCDVVIDKPAIVMKIDATVSMYHHFCDFLNLYASLHLNGSHPSMFSKDVTVMVWEKVPYRNNFDVVMKTFTNQPVLNLHSFSGKTVCFKNLVLPLLPRMIFGLYYNTPIEKYCEKSGLFHAFSRHILHRLGIEPKFQTEEKLKIAFLSRKTRYRRIINEKALLKRISNNPKYDVQLVSYSHEMSFKEQLEITSQSDIFIGIHGSGLTHLLFLPDWAVVFELYNCEDENCYLDLAHLRGVTYMTWKNSSLVYPEDEGHHPSIGAHAKFTNYEFHVEEFANLVEEAANTVWNNKEFQKRLVTHTPTSTHEEL